MYKRQILFISNRYQPYTTIQSRWQWLPISIRYRFVLQIHHIDFIEDTPFLPPTIHIRNAVGRQIGHFYFYLVISRFQPFAYFHPSRRNEPDERSRRMNGFANTILTILLSWLRALINKSQTPYDGKADLVIYDSIGKVMKTE